MDDTEADGIGAVGRPPEGCTHMRSITAVGLSLPGSWALVAGAGAGEVRTAVRFCSARRDPRP